MLRRNGQQITAIFREDGAGVNDVNDAVGPSKRARDRDENYLGMGMIQD